MIKGFHIAAGKIVTSDNKCGDTFDFLLSQAVPLNGVYHLNYAVAYLVKMMGLTPAECKAFMSGNYKYKGKSIRYAPGKHLSIGPITFADMHQYHEEELWRADPDNRHLELARRAYECAGDVYSALTSCGLHPKTLTSPIRVFQNEVLNQLDLPTVDDLPFEVGKTAYTVCKGGWLEAYKIGHFAETWDYDLCSAYPSEIYNLLDIRYGTWIKCPEYRDAEYGFAEGMVNVDADITPILYAKGQFRGDRQNYTPVGVRKDVLTRQQIDYLTETNSGEIEISDGYWWNPDKKVYPYRRIITELFEHKEKNTGLRRTIIKRIPNGLYGKMLERFKDRRGDKTGQLFNPVYSALTESNTRLKVARFANKYKENVLHIAVDGVLLDKEVTEGLSDDLGAWRLSHSGGAYVVGAGAVAIESKTGRGDFSLSYDWLKNQIAQNPDADDYVMSKPSPITLAVAINSDDYSKLGTLQETTRGIGLTFEMKRFFPFMPQSGRELEDNVYESFPLDVMMC